jgi:hypothetical protein
VPRKCFRYGPAGGYEFVAQLDDQAGSAARDEPPTLHTYSPAEAGVMLEKRMTELVVAGEAKTARQALAMAMDDDPVAARIYQR